MHVLHPIKLIIWDLDGTLVDTMADFVEALRATARAIGYGELTTDQVSGRMGRGAEGAFESIFVGSDSHLVGPAVSYFREYYPQHSCSSSKPYPGIREVLEHFSPPMQHALATAKFRSATLEILRALGLLSHFDYIVTADDIQRLKPDPQSIEIVLERAGIARPNEAVMIGDMSTDVMAGHAAGVHTIGVTYGYGDTPGLVKAGPDLVVGSPLDLLDAIKYG